MTDQAIQVKGLQKSYKKIDVLKGVDFEVEKGSIFALLGSNGAGKTTIVKILTTLLKQDSGTATVNGFDVASKPESVRQSVSLTGQFAAGRACFCRKSAGDSASGIHPCVTVRSASGQ
jgi:ABC-2 type transport system ATP-binding protein